MPSHYERENKLLDRLSNAMGAALAGGKGRKKKKKKKISHEDKKLMGMAKTRAIERKKKKKARAAQNKASDTHESRKLKGMKAHQTEGDRRISTLDAFKGYPQMMYKFERITKRKPKKPYDSTEMDKFKKKPRMRRVGR